MPDASNLVDINANYLTGQARRSCVVRIYPEGVALFFGKKSGGYSWAQVRRISFDDPGRTKANAAALVAFGVLGLASRKAFTLLTVTTDTEDLYFESDVPIAQWRTAARRIPEIVPSAAGRVFVDGQPIDASAPPTVSTQSAPGWYPDPLGLPSLRWHDGSTWTEHTAPAPTPPHA